ncbi:MAG: hypothetical protein WB823_10965 [Steroidobacteraceae bacterium]
MKTIVSECGRLIRSNVVGNGRVMRAILSTGEVARDGHTISPKGWIVPRSGRVPLIDSHRDNISGIRSVLGKVTDIHVGHAELESGITAPALLGTITFADASVNPDAEVACELYRAGLADALSVGFIPLQYSPAYDRIPGAMNISSAELLEVSCVVVPSDENARVLARAVRARLGGYETSAADRRARWQALARDDDHRHLKSREARLAIARKLGAVTAQETEAIKRDRLIDAWSGRR